MGGKVAVAVANSVVISSGVMAAMLWWQRWVVAERRPGGRQVAKALKLSKYEEEHHRDGKTYLLSFSGL